jgi:hypothetical protein
MKSPVEKRRHPISKRFTNKNINWKYGAELNAARVTVQLVVFIEEGAPGATHFPTEIGALIWQILEQTG